MTISKVGPIPVQRVATATSGIFGGKQPNFQAIIDRIGKEFSPMMKDITQLSKQIGATKLELQGKNPLAPQQLLSVQMQVSELQLKTELLSKAADSALQVTRKLQSPQ